MSTQVPVTTTREVEVIRIPSGEKILLPAGTEVVITQALGGSYTLLVHTLAGLFRLDGVNADAIGKKNDNTQFANNNASLEEQVWETLKTCYDPEIPVNIVDLGLVYEVKIEGADDQAMQVFVKMTLTAPGCGMGPVLASEAQSKISALPGVKFANVSVVWDPPWGPERISPAGREKLGMI
jgi:probable FeS assembly SUF system protein SufT